MAEQAEASADKKRVVLGSGWEKARIMLGPVGGLLTALAVASVGFFGSRLLNHQQSTDARVRLYTELMSKREDADSALRKDMFLSIIGSFLQPPTTTNAAQELLDAYLLEMELLVDNFHESLNLKPLFEHLKAQINGMSRDETAKRRRLVRLERLARDISDKQLAVLEMAGKSTSADVVFDEVDEFSSVIENEPLSLNSEGSVNAREFTLTVYEVDREKKELRVGLQVVTPATQTRAESYIEATFWVGFYDFPMIDNTRLSGNERCAVVVEGFGDEYAKVALVYFPGSHASLREKPYYEDVLKKLVAFPG